MPALCRMIPELGDPAVIEAEKTHGNTRVDFVLKYADGRSVLLEVKNVSGADFPEGRVPEGRSQVQFCSRPLVCFAFIDMNFIYHALADHSGVGYVVAGIILQECHCMLMLSKHSASENDHPSQFIQTSHYMAVRTMFADSPAYRSLFKDRSCYA